MKAYIGIDPGKTGGFAGVDEKGDFLCMGSFTNYLHFKEEATLISLDYEPVCVLEQVSAMSGQGVTSMFTFGNNYGGWLACLELLQLPHILVRPQAWQKVILGSFPKGESKKRAYDYVVRKYPKLNLEKKDSGIIDALCLAEYGRRYA